MTYYEHPIIEIINYYNNVRLTNEELETILSTLLEENQNYFLEWIKENCEVSIDDNTDETDIIWS